MSKKGNELKPRIGFFGRRNVGKSTMINWLTGQQIAIVSDTAGTTTDPVRKSMEIGGIGPVVLIDTAGIDDEGDLGRMRVEKSMAALAEVDLALLLYTEWGEPEERVEAWCREHGTPMLKVQTKAEPIDKEHLIKEIKEALPESAYRGRSLLGDVVFQGDTVVLESCEYCNSFLHFFPTIAVILDIDEDHLDFSADNPDYIQTPQTA